MYLGLFCVGLSCLFVVGLFWVCIGLSGLGIGLFGEYVGVSLAAEGTFVLGFLSVCRAVLGVLYKALGYRTFVFVRDLCVCEYLELSWVYIGLFCVGLF